MTDSVRRTMIDAAKLLGRREYSKAELKGFLLTRHPEPECSVVVDQLEKVGMLNGGGRRSIGYAGLKERLVAQGIDRGLIEMLLESDLAVEVERVKEVVRQNIPGEKDKDAIERFLSFRGVDAAVTRALLGS